MGPCNVDVELGLGAHHHGAAQPCRPLPLTVKTVNPELVRAACLQALAPSSGPAQSLRPDRITLTAGAGDTTAACLVDAHLVERVRRSDPWSPTRVTEAQFNVSVDLRDGSTRVVRVDEAAARQVALAVLASTIIEPRPVSMTEHRIVYRATVKGKACTVTLTNEGEHEVSAWQAKDLDCPR